MIGIYKIQSILKSNCIYIGSSINIFGRWYLHVWKLKNNKHENKKLQNHYNKYGLEDLQFSILLYGCSKKELLTVEQLFLDIYKPFFNICKIANNRIGVKVSDETKIKMSIVKRNKNCSIETRNKMRLAKLGKKCSEQTKERMRKPKSESTKLKMKKPKSIEHKINISNSLKGRVAWNKNKNK